MTEKMQQELFYQYAERISTPESGILAKLNRETHLTQVYPQMLSGHLQGMLLQMIVRMVRPRRILEIGTFTGYSAITMGLAGIPSGGDDRDFLLHTIEANAEFETGIRKYISEAGLEDVVILHIGEAMSVLPMLDETWDLVFIDADKENYLNYFQAVFPCVRPGGFILADNVLWSGKVLDDPEKMDRDTRGIKAFNDFVSADERCEQLLLPVRDGIMIIRKIPEIK